jgi:4-hydroxybenzoate polyprenyltransferase
VSATPRKLWTFVQSVYAPGLHIAFAAAWFLALQGALAALSGTAWRVDLRVLAAIASNFLVLFFLRVVDEIKDLDYDRKHNPDRPLVAGVVQPRDLVIYLVGTALLVLAINAALSPTLLAIVAIDLAYGAYLLQLERKSRLVRDSMWLNLVVTYPVNVLLSVYTYLFYLEQGGVPSRAGVALVAAFACAFLHYELGRKTRWPELAPPEERLYSRSLGGVGSALLALAFALAAAALVIVLLSGAGLTRLAWLPALSVVPAALGAVKFLRTKSGKKLMQPFAYAYLVAFYLALAGLAAFVRPPWS